MGKHTNTNQKGFPKPIIAFITFLAIALFGILYISIEYVPVNKENTLMQEYSYIDENFNEFYAQQRGFMDNYTFKFHFASYSSEPIENVTGNARKEYFQHGLKLGQENIVGFSLKDKTGKPVDAKKIDVLFTRLETNDLDFTKTPKKLKTGSYSIEGVTVEKPGRWKVIAKVFAGDKTGIFEHIIFAK